MGPLNNRVGDFITNSAIDSEVDREAGAHKYEIMPLDYFSAGEVVINVSNISEIVSSEWAPVCRRTTSDLLARKGFAVAKTPRVGRRRFTTFDRQTGNSRGIWRVLFFSDLDGTINGYTTVSLKISMA